MPNDDMPAYDTEIVRQLLTDALSDGQLRDLAFDHFRPAYEQMGQEMGKGAKVQRLIEYCVRQRQMARLLALVRQKNPACYAGYATRLGDVPDPTLEPTPVPSALSPPAPNPFGDVGRITDPARFFGREALLRRIFEELSKGVNVSLVGETQVGKSSILSMVCHWGPERVHSTSQAFAYLSLEWVDDEDDFYAALCDALGVATCRGFQLTRALRGRRVVLCLDEMEKMGWDGFTRRVRSHLRGLADGPAAPLKLVVASRSPLARLFPDAPELDSPLAGICRPLDVGPFPPAEARAFLTERLRGTGVRFAAAQVYDLLADSGGHPARLQRAAADLYRQLTDPQSRVSDSQP